MRDLMNIIPEGAYDHENGYQYGTQHTADEYRAMVWYHGGEAEDDLDVTYSARYGGLWFAQNPNLSGYYGPNTFKVYLHFTNPLIVTEEMYTDNKPYGPSYWAKIARNEGHDAVIIQDIMDGDRESTVCCIFDNDIVEIIDRDIQYRAGDEELDEAPIGDFTVDPNFDQNHAQMQNNFDPDDRTKRQHYGAADIKAINDPRAVEKIKSAFMKTPYTFNIYFFHSENPNYDKVVQKGIRDQQWMMEYLGVDATANILKTTSDDAITVVFTNNLSDEGYISVRSPWMIAHRIAHTLMSGDRRLSSSSDADYDFDNFVYEIMKTGYGVRWPSQMTTNGMHMYDSYMQEYLLMAGKALGTMRSARDGKLVNGHEWKHETFAQYLLTGKVTLNPLPSQIDGLPLTTDPKKLQRVLKLWQKFPITLATGFQDLLDDARGKVWIM